jgi:hypothetical protein
MHFFRRTIKMADQQEIKESCESRPVEVGPQSDSAQPLMVEESEAMNKWSELVVQVWADEKFKRQLLDNPVEVLLEHGIEVSAGMEIRVVENTEKVTYLVLPAKPVEDITGLTSSQMGAVATRVVRRFTNLRANASGIISGGFVGSTPLVP